MNLLILNIEFIKKSLNILLWLWIQGEKKRNAFQYVEIKQKNTEVYYSKEFYNFKSKPILVSNSKKMEAYVSH